MSGAASTQRGGVTPSTSKSNPAVPLRESTHEVRYLDTQKRVMTTAVAYWADKSSEELFDPRPWEVDPDLSYVVRKLTLRIFSRENVKETVKTSAHFERIGTTSFHALHEVFAHDGSPVAQVWALCVFCTLSEMKPVPIKDKEKLVLTPNLPMPNAALTSVEFPKTAPDYTWAFRVRITDCDQFGHLNNTKYPTMAEEAVALALHDDVFNGRPEVEAAAKRDTKFMHIELIDQALPFTILEVCLWWCSQKKTFLLKFQCEGKLLTEVLISTSTEADVTVTKARPKI